MEDANESIDNAGSTLKASPSEVEKIKETEIATGKKRKLPEVSKNGSPSNADESRNHGKLEILDDDDDLVIYDGCGDFGTNKKKREW